MVAFFLLFVACRQDKEVVENPRDLLVRRSLDLRGERPSPEELSLLQQDPEALAQLTETYLYSEEWGRRVRELFSEHYHTEVDRFSITASAAGVDDAWGYREALGQEPLRILQHVAEHDLPWSEIVVAEWTMATETSAQFLDLELLTEPNREGWFQARYNDSRPAAGVLSTTGLWMRYTTTQSNANRKRANMISSLLLCNDYLQKPIEFDRGLDLLDQEAIEAAVLNDPSCIGCHSSLDPLAAHLFGFWALQLGIPLEMFNYHPDRERLFRSYLSTTPAYFGEPTEGLVDLGQKIAQDPRFVECAVEQVAQGLFQREILSSDQLARHREAFIGGGLQLRALYRSLLSDPLYLTTPSQKEPNQPGAVDAKLINVDQLSSSVEALTGFKWSYQGVPLLKESTIGLRGLAGGDDGLEQLSSATMPNATMVLVQGRLAELAVPYALQHELEQELSERVLFSLIDPVNEGVSSAKGREQLQRWYEQVLSLEVEQDGPEVEASIVLWHDLYNIEQSNESAWAGVLISLFRDPLFLIY